MSLLLKIASAAAALYVVTVLGVWYGQRSLLYFPDTERVPPEEAGLKDVAEVLLTTADGNRIIAWYARAKLGEPTILYFHGNGGGLAQRADRIGFYQSHGIGIFMMSYRGYSGSTGSPSEAANVADAKLAYDWLANAGVVSSDIILYGESLGSGVAVQVAAEKPAAGLILDAPYTSIVELGAARYPYLPVRLLMTDRYETLRYIDRVRVPLLIVHGELDRTVPVEMGRKLYAAMHEPKRMVTFPEAGHSNHSRYGSYNVILGWIRDLRAGRVGQAAKP